MAKKQLTPIRGNQVEVLKLLERHGELTRADLSKKLNGAFIGSNMMGHLSKSDVQPGSLLARGYVTAATYPNKETEAEGPVHYKITAEGKKALKEALERPKATATKAAKKPTKKAAKKKAPKPLRKVESQPAQAS